MKSNISYKAYYLGTSLWKKLVVLFAIVGLIVLNVIFDYSRSSILVISAILISTIAAILTIEFKEFERLNRLVSNNKHLFKNGFRIELNGWPRIERVGEKIKIAISTDENLEKHICYFKHILRPL